MEGETSKKLTIFSTIIYILYVKKMLIFYLDKNHMILEENKIYNNKQLAEWFGINPVTLSRDREKYLNRLAAFVDFEEIGKRVKVLKVYTPIYDKEYYSNYGKIKDRIPKVWNDNGLDSSKRVSLEIQHQLMLPLTEGTVYQYTLKGRNELYGKPFGEPGSLGKCTYTWCKKVGDGWTADIIPLTEEEEELKQKLIRKYFGDVSEKQVIVKAMVETGEITAEEAWSVLEELTNMKGQGNFKAFLSELQEKLNCMVIRGTVIEPNNQLEYAEQGFDWE